MERAGSRTVVARAYATSPLRLLLPDNHGHAAWVYLATLGGGLVGGDDIDLEVDVGPGAAILLGTQASTKVYGSPRECSQRVAIDARDGSLVAVVPDPVVSFAGARYAQETRVALGHNASIFLLDGFTSGRKARGERWQFDRIAARTTIEQAGRTLLVDATRLDPCHGPVAHRMGRFDVVLTLVAMGPLLTAVRDAMLATLFAPSARDRVVVAASAVGPDGAILRIAAERFEDASSFLRPSFSLLTALLGDDPFARKW